MVSAHLTRPRSAVSISVVIPTRDRGALVERAVRSVLAQTFAPAEIIVVDDGSTDDTAARMAQFHEELRVVRQAPRGVSAARNRGVAAAGSNWIAFLDSDDLWRPDHLDGIAGAIAATSGNAALYFSDATFRDSTDARSSWERSGFAIDGPHRCDAAGDWVLLARQPMMTPAVVASRAAYTECGGMWERLRSREDTHLFFALGLRHPVCAVRDAGAIVTADARRSRLTSEYSPDGRRYWESTRALYDDLLKLDLPEHARAVLRSRLAEAHWRLARLAWKQRRVQASTASVARSIATDPRVVAERLARAAR